jgi:hypothetical protein
VHFLALCDGFHFVFCFSSSIAGAAEIQILLPRVPRGRNQTRRGSFRLSSKSAQFAGGTCALERVQPQHLRTHDFERWVYLSCLAHHTIPVYSIDNLLSQDPSGNDS